MSHARTTGADRHRHSGLAQGDAQLALLTRQVSRADSPLEGPLKLHAALRHLPQEDAAVKGTDHNDTQGAAEPGYRSSASVAREVELIARIADGDRRAFEELYNLYHRRLARFLTRLTKRYDIAEEVINDTFLVVWRKAREFRGDS